MSLKGGSVAGAGAVCELGECFCDPGFGVWLQWGAGAAGTPFPAWSATTPRPTSGGWWLP